MGIISGMGDMHIRALLVGGGLAALLSGSVAFADAPIGTYYITEAFQGGFTPQTLWAMHGSNTVRTTLTFDQTNNIYVNAGPIAINGDQVALNGINGNPNRQAQTGQILSGAPNTMLTNTGVYPTNTANTETFTDGTSDGTYAYMIGRDNASANGVIYRCNLDWSNPVPVAVMRQVYDYAGITYDSVNHSFWVTANTGFGFFNLYEVTLPSSLGVVNFNNLYHGYETGSVSALAMDVDHTLWMADNDNAGRLLHYSTSGTYLGSYTPTDTFAHPFGGEIAAPEPSCLAISLASLALLSRRREGR